MSTNIDNYIVTNTFTISLHWNETVYQDYVVVSPTVHRYDRVNTNNYGARYEIWLKTPSGSWSSWTDQNFGSGSGWRELRGIGSYVYYRTDSAYTLECDIYWNSSTGTYYNGSFHTTGSGNIYGRLTVPALDRQAPNNPTNQTLSLSEDQTRIIANWNATSTTVRPINSQHIALWTGNGPWIFTYNINAGLRTYSWPAEPNTFYKYKVATKNNIGESWVDVEAWIYTTPHPPKVYGKVALDRSISIYLNSISIGFKKFQLSYQKTDNSTWSEPIEITTNTYTLSPEISKDIYNKKIRAREINQSGIASAWTDVLIIERPQLMLSVPSGLKTIKGIYINVPDVDRIKDIEITDFRYGETSSGYAYGHMYIASDAERDIILEKKPDVEIEIMPRNSSTWVSAIIPYSSVSYHTDSSNNRYFYINIGQPAADTFNSRIRARFGSTGKWSPETSFSP